MKKIIMMGFALLIILLSINLFGKVNLFLKLEKIIREPNIDQEFTSSDGVSFSDEYININWTLYSNMFDFEIMNKAKATMLLIWDESSFVNENGYISKVVPGKSRLMEKATSFPPTAIPFYAKFSDGVYPVNYITWGSNDWYQNQIYPEKLSDKEFEKIKNKTLIYRVVLTFKIGEEKHIYHFLFKAFAKRK